MDKGNPEPSRETVHDSVEMHDEFVRLLTQNQRRIYGYILTIVLNSTEAEDLLQQTSFVLWRKMDEYDPSRDFVRWACGIAHNEVLNFLQKRRRNRVVFDGDLVTDLARDYHEHSGEESDRYSALAACVEELPDRDRRLIEQCYSSNQTIKEVAEGLGRPVKTIYNTLGRVRRLLYQCVGRKTGPRGLA